MVWVGADEASGQTFPARPGRFKAGHDHARPRPYPIDRVHSIAYFYQMELCPHLFVDPVRWRSSPHEHTASLLQGLFKIFMINDEHNSQSFFLFFLVPI